MTTNFGKGQKQPRGHVLQLIELVMQGILHTLYQQALKITKRNFYRIFCDRFDSWKMGVQGGHVAWNLDDGSLHVFRHIW